MFGNCGKGRRLIVEESGNVTIFSTFMMVLILTIAGAGIDIMRQEASRVRLQSTLDRAVLAAADLDQMQEPAGVVNDYLAKAGLAELLGGVSVQEGLYDRVVTAEAQPTMNTIFLHMAGYDTLSPYALSTAEERISNVEISLVLDISGSMRHNGRMERLKPAASSFVEKVMTERSEGITTLNLVPFAGQVNPGDIMFDYFRGERPSVTVIPPEIEDDFFPPWPQAISNVVMYFDTDGDDIFDRAHKIESFPEDAPRDADAFFRGAAAYAAAQDGHIPSSAQFLGMSIKGGEANTRYFTVRGDSNGPESDLGPTKNNGKIPGATYSYGQIDYEEWALSYAGPTGGLATMNVNMPSSCIEVYPDEFANTNLPVSDDYVPHFHHWENDPEVMDWGWCPEDDSAIQYYSSDVAALTDFINDMRMHDGTGAQIGMKYALALLDPNTRDAINHLVGAGVIDAQFYGRPIDWDDPETEKFIVIMTDGQVTEQFRPTDPFAPVNGEEELTTQGSGSYTVMSPASENVGYLHMQCELARDLGVTVFTIAFETDAAATEEMRQCASSDSHAFHVQGDEISETFDTIARQINNLRLIQ